jgi:hypothetical protein
MVSLPAWAAHPDGATEAPPTADSNAGVLPAPTPATPTAPSHISLPPREASACAPTSRPITPADQVYSEWGTIPNASGANHEFVRIVKNKEKAGYAIWYCTGQVPALTAGVRDFSGSTCWSLVGEAKDPADGVLKSFFPQATDEVLKNCGLIARMKDGGFNLPGRIGLTSMLMRGPYPIQFGQNNIDSKSFCETAAKAFKNCLGI